MPIALLGGEGEEFFFDATPVNIVENDDSKAFGEYL